MCVSQTFPGNGQSLSEGGLNNEIGTTKERNRKDRGARNNADAAPAEEYVAPAEEYVPPAEGDYQAYADEGYVEPVPAVEETVVDAPTQHGTSAEAAEHRSRHRELDALGRGRGSGGLGAGSNESEATSAHIVHTGSIDEARGPVT